MLRFAETAWWPILAVPIWQELLFRYLPYKFLYLQFGGFWEIGIISNLVFASIHWYFGKWFTIWAFFWGFVCWALMVRFGLLPAILIHVLVNFFDLELGVRDFLIKHK